MDPNKNNQPEPKKEQEYTVPSISAYKSIPKTPLPHDDESNNTKGIIVKIILVIIGIAVLFVAFGIIKIYRDDAIGQRKFEEATQRCGHTPIVYDHEDNFQFGASNPRLELASILTTGPNNEYYCTLTEAKADGHSQVEIDIVQEEINNATDIPANVKSEYR